jgi:predicted lipid-binding transport protein (Tim44 family)
MTRIFGAASLGVLLFGIIAGQSLHDMTKTWVTASLTLFVVALVLLVLIMRDQHKAIAAVEGSLAAAPAANTGRAAAASPAAASPAAASQSEPTAADVEPAPAQEPAGGTTTAGGTATGTATATRLHVATVERGRIASLAGVVALIWLVILVLMVWRP